MQKYNNGHPIDVSKMPINDYELAAKEWAEGSKSLEKLLLYCLKNNIVTQACCIGHKTEDKAFLQFELSEKNMSAIIKIINRYYNFNGVNMIFLNQPGVIVKFDIRVSKNVGEQFFEDMLSQLSNGLSVGIDALTPDMSGVLDMMMKHKIPNEYLEVQYSMNDNERKLFVATTNPNYSETYWDKEEAISWMDDSVGIEGVPEKIIPIINDISKKTSIEYSNYIENQKRTEMIKQQLITEKRVEDKIIPIVANPQATRENDFARKNGMTIVEVLPGMSIDVVAKAVCGQRYICKFNNFVIVGTNYQSFEQIVTAYDKYLEERKEKKEVKVSTINNQDLITEQELQVGRRKR